MRRSFLCGLLLLGVTAIAGGCSNTDTTTIQPTPTATTEPDFTGILTIHGATSFPFSTTAAGQVTATIIALDSAADGSLTQVGLSLGLWNGNSCQVVLANDNALLTSVVTGSASGIGELCARVYDVGKLTVPVSFTVQVVHY